MTGPDPSAAPVSAPSPAPAWKVLLALLSLSLSVLLWLQGLASSLERPSVVNALSLRQLELSVLAAGSVPPPLRAVLVGEDPRGELAKELRQQMEGASDPPLAVQRLELALLEPQAAASRVTLQELVEMVDAPRRPLPEALLRGRPLDPQRRAALLAPWAPSLLLEQLSCEELGGPAAICPVVSAHRQLLLRLLAVNVLPFLLVLVGVALLLREAWLLVRRRLSPPPPLQGPPLSLVDVTLLIAGGFVVLGEVLAPTVLEPPLTILLERWRLAGALGQGVQVLFLYAGLMAAPLAILSLLLRRPSSRAPGTGLEWRWRPPGSALRLALVTLLKVVPLVALTSWLIERLWGEASGSNPLLELVLTSADPRALALFALTAIVLAPLFEETLFRGVLLPVVGRRFGGVWAVLVSATVFAVAHLSLSELPPLLVLGLGLGWLRWRSGRLAPCVLLHGLWNSLTFTNLLLLAG